MSADEPSTRDDGLRASLIRTLSALSNPTRLRVYLDLLAALPGGRPSGEIAVEAGAAATTMSAHLAVLSRAGLAVATRHGKSMVYAADPRPARELAAFLAQVVAGR